MSFHEVRFPVKVSIGSSGGPMRKTDIVELGSGFEERNTSWAHSRRKYNVGYGIKTLNQLHDVLAFFEARFAKLYGFRYKDWADYKSCPPENTPVYTDQTIGTGTGTQTQFQITKQYTSGPSTYTRSIRKPVAGTISVGINSVLQATNTYTVDATTGIITFNSAPANGALVSAGYQFDVPVRFDTDEISINLSDWRMGQFVDIPMVEVRV